MTPEKKLGVRFIFFWIKNKYEYISQPECQFKGQVTRIFFILDRCSIKGIKMFKLVSLLILLYSLPVASFTEYGNKPRTIPLQAFKDRFTTGELIGISTAYAEDVHIRAAISDLKTMDSVNLDSEVIKKDVSYLASKSILSEERARDILK